MNPNEQFDDERELLAPLAEPPKVIPAPPPPAPANYGYGPGADASALAAAEQERNQADQAAQLASAATTINHAFGGNVGDLGAPIRANREESIKDVLRRRQVEDQNTEHEKAARVEALTQALAKPDSPESMRLKDQFSGTTVGGALKARLGDAAWARLPGNAIPGAKEQLVSETALLKGSQSHAGDMAGTQAIVMALKQSYPDKFTPDLEAQVAKMDPAKAQAFASFFQRQHQPTVRLFTEPSTGFVYPINRKENLTALPRPLNGEAPPLDTSISVKDPSAMPVTAPMPAVEPETPKMKLARQQDILKLGSPPSDFAWDPKILSGEIPPPNASEVKTANDVTSAAGTILDFGQKLNGFLAKHPDGYPVGKDATAVEPFIQGINVMVRKANDMGVYRAYDQPILDQIIRNPTSLKTILSSAVGIRDLRTQVNALLDETKQRSWSLNQQIHRAPVPGGRLAGFKPTTALPAARPQRTDPATGEVREWDGHTWVSAAK
jgi:hypothetical protein